jgi:hypothetical protein
MQPYFFPYLGYFRLMKVTDIFVILDNVQFQRRGWIHRNKFTKQVSDEDWLTLPVIKGNRDETQIRDLNFRTDITMPDLITPFKINRNLEAITELWPSFSSLDLSLLDYLEVSMTRTADILNLPKNFIRSSQVASKVDLKGEEYIIHLCELLGAKIYVNAPGGKKLYSPHSFAHRGISLKFLEDYKGSFTNCMERILYEDIFLLQREIIDNSLIENK